ncbi:MAG: hypothetical protein IPJ26_01220 [Bacteroidetes bacterium]|nr:hypothetical protein [Bacteroidota bacterium]
MLYFLVIGRIYQVLGNGDFNGKQPILSRRCPKREMRVLGENETDGFNLMVEALFPSFYP